jgi:hypothetical protein
LAFRFPVLIDEAIECAFRNVNTTPDHHIFELARIDEASDLTLTDTNTLS